MTPDRCFALPSGVLDRPDLSTVAKLVAAALNDRFARFDPSTWVGNRRLAQAIGRSIGHARRGLTELIRHGLVGREETDQTPTGRRLWLLWRDQAVALFTGAQPPCPPARTYSLEALTVGQLRDVTRIETTKPAEDHQAAVQQAQATGPAIAPPPNCEPALRSPGASSTVLPIPAAIKGLKYGAPPEVRADLVNRIAHRLHDKNPATYGFLRKWVNAAADGVGGALDALAHGYAKAEAAILSHHPCPGRVLVRRVQDFMFRPPAASSVGAVEAHVAARPVPLKAAVPEPADPPPSVEQVAELEAGVRDGDRVMRRFKRLQLVKLSEGGLEVPPDIQAAAVAALARLVSVPR
jgi:hypothetical protein